MVTAVEASTPGYGCDDFVMYVFQGPAFECFRSSKSIMSSSPTNSIMSPSKSPLPESAPLMPGVATAFRCGPSPAARFPVNDAVTLLRQFGQGALIPVGRWGRPLRGGEGELRCGGGRAWRGTPIDHQRPSPPGTNESLLQKKKKKKGTNESEMGWP